jgi:hypothetical protein
MPIIYGDLTIQSGTLSTSGLVIPTGASSGYVLTSDSSGNTNWSNPKLYKSYVALLTQTSSNAPTANVLENDFGITATFSYISLGGYYLYLGSQLTPSKTVVFTGSPDQLPIGGNFAHLVANRIDNDRIILSTFDVDGSGLTDGLLNDTPIEIRVYP